MNGKGAQNDLAMTLYVVSGVLALAVIVLGAMVFKLRTTFKSLIAGARGDNLEKLLLDHMAERSRMDDMQRVHTERLDGLDSKMESSKRYLGLHRYNAFDDVGGEQSFALAFYDELGHGVVISSIVGRNTNRVYCKEIVSGKALKDLSTEEQTAIEIAAKNRARTLQATR